MQDPEKRSRLHSNLPKFFPGFNVPREQFDADMGVSEKDEEFQSVEEPTKKDQPAPVGAASAESSPPPASAPVAGEPAPRALDWDFLNKLPAGPQAELATLDGAAPVRTVEGQAGARAQRVIDLPKPEKNTERVRLPDDLPAEAEPPGTYRLDASTEPQARYFDRPLSKVAAGETEEQDKWTAAGRTFANSIKEMGQGLPEYLAAAGRRLDVALGMDPAKASVLNMPLDYWANRIEESKEKVAPFHAQGELELTNPATWPVPAARTAALALPLVLSAAFPESKIATVLQGIGAAGFDSQMVHASFERARQAGLVPGSKEYDTYALADATATLLVFKGLGHVLEAPAQALLRRALITETMERVAAGEVFDAAFAAASKSRAQLLRTTASGAVTMGAVGAANAVKTKVGERAFNAATDTQTFPEQALGDDAADVLREAGSMALIGGAAGLAGGVGAARVEAPAFDVVRPTGQIELSNVRLLGVPERGGYVRILTTNDQGQPVEARVHRDYLRPTEGAASQQEPRSWAEAHQGERGLAQAGPATQVAGPRQYGTPVENRAAGSFEKDRQTYTRQPVLGERIARGTEAVAHFAENVAQPIQWAVMEAADLQPSHTAGSQNLNHFLPEAQPKNRSAAFDKASQQAIASIADAPDLGRLSEAPNAYVGAPIINGRGEVIQGNGRAEGIRQHYRQSGQTYRQGVTVAAQKVGVAVEQMAGMKEPVLVRVADVSDKRAQDLGNYTATDLESGGKRRLDTRQAASRLDNEGRADLARILQPQGGATLAETIRSNAVELLRLLRKRGLANATQLQTLAKADGTLTAQGVEDIAALYRHGLFQGGEAQLPELFAELPMSAQGGLDRAIAALLGGPKDKSIAPEVQRAIVGVHEFLNSDADFKTWANQADIFRGGEAPTNRYSPLEMRLIELLTTEKRPTIIAKLLNEYARQVRGEEGSLFGSTPSKSRAEAVREVFGVPNDVPRTKFSKPPVASTADKSPAAGSLVQRAPQTAPLTAADVEPQVGPVKPIRQVFADLRKALGGAITFGRGKEAAGYDPSSRVTTFKPNDIKDAAHEIGHAVDDRFRLAPKADAATDAELQTLYGLGSPAPANHPSPLTYEMAEAKAEFFRRLLLQPAATRQQFPRMMEQYERLVPAETRAGIEEFGRQARGHLSDPLATNIEYGTEQPGRVERFQKWLKGGGTPGNPVWFSRWDRFLGDWVDPLRPFQKAEDYFRRILDKPLDPQHPRSVVNQMVRLYDLMGKIEDISTRGMRAFMPRVTEDANGVPSTERILDGVTGQAKTDEWLFQPFAVQGGDHAAAKAKREYAGKVGVAQRTVKLFRDRLAARVEDVLDEGGVVAPAFLARHPDVAQRKIQVTDRATATSPRSKRVITFEQANQENLARRQAHTQRVRDAQQKRGGRIDAGIDKQVDRWKDYGKRAYKAWKQSKSSNEAAAIIDELLGKVEAEEAGADFSGQGKRVAGKVTTLLKRAARELSKARAEGREAKADAILERLSTKIEERVKGLEKLRQARQKANGEKYDGKVAGLARREQFSAIDDTPGEVITGLGRQGSGAADVAAAEKILTHHEALKQSDPTYATDVEEGLRRYRSLAQDVLGYLRDAGRLTSEQYEAITEGGADYIALQRILEPAPGEDVADTFARTARKGIGGGGKVVHRFKGSGRSIKDPWVSLLASRTRSIDAADRNAVLRSWRDLAVDSRQMYERPATEDAADGPGNLMRRVGEAKDGNLTIYVDGVPEYWQVDADFAKFITEFGEVLPGNIVTKVMGVFKGLLTKTPKFVVRNLPRDLLDQLINSRSGQAKGIARNLGPNGQAWRNAADELLEAHGGSQGGQYPRTEVDYDAYIDRTIATVNKSKKSFATRTADVGRKYMELVEGSERLGRRREATAAYQQYKDAGYSPEDAALAAAMQARGLMDFARAGRVARKFNQYFPFLTARIAGLRTMFTSIGHSPAKWTMRYVRYAVAPVLMEQALIALMGRDDEYEQKSVAEKQGFFNIPLPDGGWLMVAKPFEIGASATALVATVKEYGFGVENATEGQRDHLAKSFLPAEDFVPTGPVGAAVDAARNIDTWNDRQLVPEREKNLRLDDPNRHQERASRLGQGLGWATRIDARKVDYFIRSTTGMVGQLAQGLSDTGREGKGVNVEATGLFKPDPVAHARDVEWLNQKFTEWGVTKNADMQQLKAKVDAWYDADEADKPELGEQVRELARELRRKYPEEEIRRLRADKDGFGAEGGG